MTQNFIYAYTAIPENLNDNGMAFARLARFTRN